MYPVLWFYHTLLTIIVSEDHTSNVVNYKISMDRPTPDDKTEESFTFCFKILLFCIVFNLNAIYVSKSLVIEKFPMIRFKFDPHDSTVLNVSKVFCVIL